MLKMNCGLLIFKSLFVCCNRTEGPAERAGVEQLENVEIQTPPSCVYCDTRSKSSLAYRASRTEYLLRGSVHPGYPGTPPLMKLNKIGTFHFIT